MIDMTREAVTKRLRIAAQTDLSPERRLDCKLDMSPAGITRRLASVEAARRFCMTLVEIGRRNLPASPRRDPEKR